MTLSRPAAMINLGDVVRKTEPNFNIAECFDIANNRCVITPTCDLKAIFSEAQTAFLKVMDKYTLDDAVVRQKHIKNIIGLSASAKDSLHCTSCG